MGSEPDVRRDGVDPSETACHLVRTDGSRWRVGELIFTRHGLKVDAKRITPAHRDGDRLQGVYLADGDRLEWVDGDGAVVRTHRKPADGG